MGLMLGEFVDEYNVRVVDIFAMPQSGTGITVETVGWYHPGFGCWLSSTDVSTQSSFEQLCKKAVAVTIDPIQSVKGKVAMDAFRNINSMSLGR